jgi:putative nucleotidyltransferase with HDIG domain
VQAAPHVTTGADRWERHRAAALAVETAALLLPAVAGVMAATVAAAAVPSWHGAGQVLWWVAVLGVGGAAIWVTDRLARRTLPLAVLLRLSLQFPDRAPSLFRVALRAGTVRHLDQQLAALHHDGVQGDPREAAAKILGLATALARYDRRTRGHSERVRAFTDLIAEELRLPAADRDRLRWSSLLHDIGKLHVDVAILNKPAALDSDEWESIRRHPHVGAQMTAPLRPWLGEWATAIEHHHERWDGGGYPHGIAGDEIALGARIVAVADAFEVMTAPRPYRSAPMSVAAAREELLKCAGQQFDPAVVRALLAVSLTRLRWVVGPMALLLNIPLVDRVGAVIERGRPATAFPRLAAVAVVAAGLTLAPLDHTQAPGDAADATEADAPPAALGIDVVPAASEARFAADDGAAGSPDGTADAAPKPLAPALHPLLDPRGLWLPKDERTEPEFASGPEPDAAPVSGADASDAPEQAPAEDPAMAPASVPETEDEPPGFAISAAARDHSHDDEVRNHGEWVVAAAHASRR